MELVAICSYFKYFMILDFLFNLKKINIIMDTHGYPRVPVNL